MIVIKLKIGGLWVYVLVVLMVEMVVLLDEFDVFVEYVVLFTILFEYKIFVGLF